MRRKEGELLKRRNKLATVVMSFLFIVSLWATQIFVARAQETDIPGYHEYVVTEDEVIDTWYGVLRGTYLRDGTSGLKKAGTAKVNVSGTTTAHSKCDSVRAAVYLDESSNGGSSFGTIGVYHFEEKNTASCHGSKANISVTKGWKYRVRGVHSVIEGSTVETIDTCTGTLTAS